MTSFMGEVLIKLGVFQSLLMSVDHLLHKHIECGDLRPQRQASELLEG